MDEIEIGNLGIDISFENNKIWFSLGGKENSRVSQFRSTREINRAIIQELNISVIDRY
jgi:hypothetical protein